MPLLPFQPYELKKSCKKENVYPHYYLIVGEELLLQKEALEAVQSVACDPSLALACQEIEVYTEADKFDIKELLAQCNSSGLFGIRRFIKFLFNKKPDAKTLKSLTQLIQENDQENVYVFSFLIWDKVLQNSDFVRALNEISSIALVYECNPLKEQAYITWIKRRLKEMKFTYTEEVPLLLSELFQNNMFALQQLLEQIKIREISDLNPQIINQTTDLFSDYEIYNLIDAVIAGELSKTDQILKYLIFTKKKPINLIIASFKYELQKYYQLAVTNVAPNPLSHALAPLVPSDHLTRDIIQNIKRAANYNHNKEKHLKNLLSRLSRQHLYKLLIYIQDLDTASKTYLSESQVISYLEKFFLLIHTQEIQYLDYNLFAHELEL